MASYYSQIIQSARPFMHPTLEYFQSTAEPITAEDLRKELEIPVGKNAWQKALNHMVNHWWDEDIYVGSGPLGYYLIRTPAEMRATYQYLRTKLLSGLRRASKVKRAIRRMEEPDYQLGLFEANAGVPPQPP